MFTNILVPIDFSDRNLPAIQAAADLAKAGKGHVRLFHVIEPLEGHAEDDEEQFFARLERKARQVLSCHGDLLQSSGIDWDSEIQYGHRAREIVARARHMEADLIVMASHRMDPARPGGGWGTLSYQVAILADCPVLLVK